LFPALGNLIAQGQSLFTCWLLVSAYSSDGEGLILNSRRVGLLSEVFISFIVVVDPLVTILIVPGYRRAVIRAVCPWSGLTTTASSIASRTTILSKS